MATYVMVHGAWCGAWCWEDIIPSLEKAGHKVINFDLPGHGDDPTPVETVTLDSCVSALAAQVDKADEPVILVSHSMGGIVISQYAERYPEKVKKLVYVTAFLIGNGQTMFNDWMMKDTESAITPDSTVIDERGLVTLKPEYGREIGFAQCTMENMMRAVTRMKPDCTNLWMQPLQLSKEVFGKIPKAYVFSTQDRANTIGSQRKMVEIWPCEQVFEIDGDHAVWYSRPQELIEALLAVC